MNWLSFPRLLVLSLLSVAVTGCVDNTATATFPVGSEVRLSSADLGLPAELRDSSGGGAKVASVPCLPDGTCGALPIAAACVSGVCDPEPITLTAQVGNVIDFDALVAGLDTLFAEVRSIELLSLEYEIRSNTSTMGVEPVEVFWAPAGAVDVDPSMGARRLGVVPALSAMETGTGAVSIDADGSRALSAHVVGTDPRIKLFVRTGVDLDPGATYPEGEINLAVRITLRVTGTIL